MSVFQHRLNKLIDLLRVEMLKKWKRSLPMGELFTDRWEKARSLGFGEKTSIYDSSIVMGDNIKVGKCTWIGPNTLLDGTGKELSIGDNCDISAGVQIYTHNTVKRCVSGGNCKIETGIVKIGDCCYIGPYSILAGQEVSIGSHSVVGAHSFVNKSFSAYSIIAGIPAKKIGEVVIENDKVSMLYYRNKKTEN